MKKFILIALAAAGILILSSCTTSEPQASAENNQEGAGTSLQQHKDSYPQLLDSLAFYLGKTSFYSSNTSAPLQLITHYKPVSYNAMSETSDDKLYRDRTGNQKNKVILFDGSLFYVLDLAAMDSTFIQKWRGRFLQITDPNGELKFPHSNIAREFNNREGRLEPEIILSYRSPDQHAYLQEKLQYFLNLAIEEAKYGTNTGK